MSDKNALIDFECVSDVAIKLLEMIEKSVGWVAMPKGVNRDFNEAIEGYKEYVLKNDNIEGLEKYAKIATARNDLKKYINQGKIIRSTLDNLDNSANMCNLDDDWLLYFFEYAKNISNEYIQDMWGKLLACKVNGADGITKKLVNAFSLMEQADVELFCMLCSMSFDNISNLDRQYPFIYIRKYPAYYNNCGIRRHNLAQLDNLGLIEYDSHGNFVLPSIVPVLKYDNYEVYLKSDNRISCGNIRFTSVGRALYKITNVPPMKDFLDYCKKMWDKMDIHYQIKEIEKM
ncbi:MAG: DUF2806 domain-containing protein [Lachnospiraceae bacterium]|nr:DUF2806 domain-containing protein [Lachnospiraceae bacterium]